MLVLQCMIWCFPQHTGRGNVATVGCEGGRSSLPMPVPEDVAIELCQLLTWKLCGAAKKHNTRWA